MKLYELTLTYDVTLQGNIEIKVFDTDHNELESRFFLNNDGLSCSCDGLTDIEDSEIWYIYAERGHDGTPWLVVEVIRETEV